MLTENEFWEQLGSIVECSSMCHLCPANTICIPSSPCKVTLQEMYERVKQAERECKNANKS